MSDLRIDLIEFPAYLPASQRERAYREAMVPSSRGKFDREYAAKVRLLDQYGQLPRYRVIGGSK